MKQLCGPGHARVLVSLLLGSGLVLALPAGAVLENLALNRPYVCSDDLLSGWTGLADGLADSDGPPGCFATANSGRFPKHVVIDLGAVCRVSKITVQNSSNGNTRHVALLLSPDANEFESLREYYFPARSIQTLTHSFAPRQARYVKLVFYDSWKSGAYGANCLFVREMQVFGEPPAQPLTVNGREELRLARGQPTVTSTPAVALFRRYCLGAGGKLRLGVLGDSYAAIREGQIRPWPEILAELLEAKLGEGQVELLNLASEGQRLAQARDVMIPLVGEDPADVVLLAYGRDAALAHIDQVAFRNAWQKLVEAVQERLPALLVVVTPAPLLRESGTGVASVLSLSLAQERLARQQGLPVVRSAAVLAAQDNPAACYGEHSFLNSRGHQAIAEAVYHLLWGEE